MGVNERGEPNQKVEINMRAKRVFNVSVVVLIFFTLALQGTTTWKEF